ncbi:MAG TPA: NAD-dependent deacylase [Thermoanaerobaculia bacterium]|nr:NAD-dependent deacylase [Thermoanaerobaculia bacterium]
MPDALSDAIHWIESHHPSHIAVLTGAGVSAESGIPTFRDAGGLWETYRAEELATPQAFARDPALVWRWYESRRALVRQAQPNAAHEALARLERSIAGRGELTLITQNVDGLHARAGSSSLIELHGNLFRVRCFEEETVSERMDPFDQMPPRCDCGSLLRPDVVWFGELLPPGFIERAADAVARADLLMVLGTSGVVHPAAGLVSMLRHGEAIEVNPARTPLSRLARFSIQAPAAEVVPRLVAAIEKSLP